MGKFGLVRQMAGNGATEKPTGATEIRNSRRARRGIIELEAMLESVFRSARFLKCFSFLAR
jgi:hypothetical protein